MNYKTALILLFIFLVFTFIVIFVPDVTQLDIEIIKNIQKSLAGYNSQIPVMFGGILFYIITCFPLAIAGIYFCVKKMYKNIFLYTVVPFLAYLINSIVKIIVQRPRPSIELQIEEHMKSSSYVSRHTFVTACLWGMFIYLVCKYCKNRHLKFFFILISVIWIVFEGFTRIWAGVHNPTDVVGAFILSGVFLILYIKYIYETFKN